MVCGEGLLDCGPVEYEFHGDGGGEDDYEEGDDAATVRSAMGFNRANSLLESSGEVHGDDLLASTSGRSPARRAGVRGGGGEGGGMSFAELGSEILELHAFVTTNVIVVRQVLIRYDAYAR